VIATAPLIAVYVTFVAKQLVADYLLQTGWMVHGKGSATGWLVPLSAHAGIHAALTLGIALAVRPGLWWLAVVDFALHFAVDRGKALVMLRLQLTHRDKGFWWAIGIDQAIHQLTHFAYVVLLVVR
jgi:hypothetical protein